MKTLKQDFMEWIADYAGFLLKERFLASCNCPDKKLQMWIRAGMEEDCNS